jgi:hypothetical protein
MRNKRFLFAALAASAILAQETVPSKSAALPVLVRRDLVSFSAREFPPAKRDLFSTQTFSPGRLVPLSGPANPTSAAEKPEPAEAPQPALALRYVGYARNPGRTKFVALVMFEGQLLTVEAGDVIGPGWKVLRITAKEIEVEGPDGKIETFAFEGELR